MNSIPSLFFPIFKPVLSLKVATLSRIWHILQVNFQVKLKDLEVEKLYSICISKNNIAVRQTIRKHHINRPKISYFVIHHIKSFFNFNLITGISEKEAAELKF